MTFSAEDIGVLLRKYPIRKVVDVDIDSTGFLGIDPGVARSNVDDALVLVDGEVAADGTWDDLARTWGHLAG